MVCSLYPATYMMWDIQIPCVLGGGDKRDMTGHDKMGDLTVVSDFEGKKPLHGFFAPTPFAAAIKTVLVVGLQEDLQLFQLAPFRRPWRR